MKPYFSGRFAGATPVGVFLLVTLVLAGWLGYQAVDAAASHRRTVEAVLSDYSLISATELARVARSNMSEVLEDVFDPVSPGRTRWRGVPSPEVLARGMESAMRRERCDCPAFRAPLALFRLAGDPPAPEFLPDTFPPALRQEIVDGVLAAAAAGGRGRGLFTTGGEGAARPPVAVGYALSGGGDGAVETAFGFVVPLDAVGELFEDWYSERQLLPQPIAGEHPNDSLLHVVVRDPTGHTVFASLAGFYAPLAKQAALPAEYGGLLVEAAVRPEAAARLVIGGLPGARLPLLFVLLLLTLGVGIAAVVQLRREQAFQRLRDDFVSGVSHELRTPLAQIRMFSDLQQTGKLTSEEDRARAVFVIHREARRLSHLVENVLQFSRLRRSPGAGMPRERLDFGEALADGIDAVTPLLEDRGMRLEVSTEPGLTVFANREALTRIVVNLLDNAVKYGPRGQAVKIRIQRVDGCARLSVIDQGPGIPASERGGIWKPYRRLDRDIRARLPGTGIGLSVVSRLAFMHGGTCWVEDGPGGGSGFVVELPLARGNGGSAEGAAGA